ncbi:O-antigen ligase family protein [Planktothricoides raciborskii]|uniref:O-antigen ligase family protein n=1 Tax=Planktothricoides raciborskii FACHB-1370 TaxID=2949576 RepID=A0ABR8EA23_9CYAN|nr:O-antigen ligase family protein [Planktothricoides raciborskii]MBD2542550.1 O-antigen ligase family protein [Planktothricoides raciborskii FACHB-1370]MBD2581007.1 O-antigen ligase family protein [Planktothricoides raciborskii FACHB-1261]
MAFQLVSKYPKFGYLVEKIILGLYLFLMPGVGISPFPNFHPSSLGTREKSFAGALVQLVVYGVILFILSPRLKSTLKYSVEVLAVLLQKNLGLFLFLLLLFLSFSWSDTPIHTLKYSTIWLGTTIVNSYIIKQYKYHEIDKLLRYTMAINAVLSTYYSMFRPAIAINPAKNSWQGILSHPNTLAAIMSLSAILWGIEAIDNPKKRWISVAMALFSLYVMQKCESGGGKVQFLLGTLMVMSVSFLRKLPFQWAYFFVIIFMIISIAGFIIVTDNLEAIVVGGLGKDMTLTGRTPLWEFLFTEKIPKRPILGYGFHGFWQPWRGADNPAANHISGELRMPSGDGYWKPPHAHNGFIEIIIDLGYVGFACFAFSFFTTLADAVRYLTLPQPPGTPMIESILPLLLLMFVIFPNLTEIPLVENNHNWYYYVFASVGLSIKNCGKSLTGYTKN